MVTNIPIENCTIMLCSVLINFMAPLKAYDTLFNLPDTKELSF
jgi:hypothetical protein